MISTSLPISNTLLPSGNGNDTPNDLKSVAQAFESLFARELLSSMRKANEAVMSGDDDVPMMGDDVRFFYSLFDSQLAQHLSDNGGLGIADALIRQLGDDASDAVKEG